MSVRKIIENSLRKEFERYVKNVETVMKSEVHKKSGNLMDSISDEFKGEFHALVGVDVAKLINDSRNIGSYDYSIPYYYGIKKGYWIYPVRAKYLRWEDAQGNVHYAKKVFIPPRAGDKFIERTLYKLPKFGG